MVTKKFLISKFDCITVNFVIQELKFCQITQLFLDVSVSRETKSERNEKKKFHKIPSPASKDGLDVLVTGHEDGSVKFWNCSSIALSLMASIKTGRYVLVPKVS